jgi:hypothetical protein
MITLLENEFENFVYSIKYNSDIVNSDITTVDNVGNYSRTIIIENQEIGTITSYMLTNLRHPHYRICVSCLDEDRIGYTYIWYQYFPEYNSFIMLK